MYLFCFFRYNNGHLIVEARHVRIRGAVGGRKKKKRKRKKKVSRIDTQRTVVYFDRGDGRTMTNGEVVFAGEKGKMRGKALVAYQVPVSNSI